MTPKDLKIHAVVEWEGKKYRWYLTDPIYPGTTFLRPIEEKDLALSRFATIPMLREAGLV